MVRGIVSASDHDPIFVLLHREDFLAEVDLFFRNLGQEQVVELGTRKELVLVSEAVSLTESERWKETNQYPIDNWQTSLTRPLAII